jgi:hypothetical protein
MVRREERRVRIEPRDDVRQQAGRRRLVQLVGNLCGYEMDRATLLGSVSRGRRYTGEHGQG